MKNYIKYIKRQGKHIQHIHAGIFAGSVTFIIAAFILYYDYGFWHEKYVRDETVMDASSTVTMESPSQSFSNFLSEAKSRFIGVKEAGSGSFEGKESYTK